MSIIIGEHSHAVELFTSETKWVSIAKAEANNRISGIAIFNILLQQQQQKQ